MARPKDEIRVGLIGFGFASKTFHVPLLHATPGYRIVAVSSRRPAEVQMVLPGVDVIADPIAIATHAGVDLVVIASPNDTHAPLAEAALRAGRNVVVDKPFTISVAQARQLATVAVESGTLLSVFHNRRWDSDFLTVRSVIQEGVLGEVALFESRIDRYRPEVRDRWRENPGPGSGLLYDLAPHLIDQALLVFGIPDDVQGTLAKQRNGAMTDDYFHLLLRYGRRIVILQAGTLVSGGGARFAVHGDRASVVKHKPDLQEDQLRAGMIPGTPGWGMDPDNAVIYDGATGETRELQSVPGDQRGYYAALREALRGRAPNPVSPAQGVAVMAIIEAAFRAAADGRQVLPELTEEERAPWA